MGKYASDTVCLGNVPEICLENFGFIQATKMSQDPFNDLPFDGILGLGLLPLSVTE